MAKRRRFGKVRAAASRFFRKARRGKSYGAGTSVKGVLLGAAIYGAAREKVAVAISPLTDKIPFLSKYGVADEVTLGVVSYMMAKKGSGIVKNIGQAGMAIEAARIAEQALKGFSNGQPAVNGYNSSTSQGAYSW